MPPKVRPGAAGRATRKQQTRTAELNCDTSGASDALAVALRLVATVAVEMRKIRKGSGEQTVCGYTIERRMDAGAVKLSFVHTAGLWVLGSTLGSCHPVVRWKSPPSTCTHQCC